LSWNKINQNFSFGNFKGKMNSFALVAGIPSTSLPAPSHFSRRQKGPAARAGRRPQIISSHFAGDRLVSVTQISTYSLPV